MTEPPGPRPRLHQRLGQRFKVDPDVLVRSRWLRPVARHLAAPELWHLQPEAVARGAAIGIFWAFALPFGQVLAAAAHCIWWRGNIPVAGAVTLITNPLTLGFWLWLAYRVGTLVVDAPPFALPGRGRPFTEWLQDVGVPVVLGMGSFAIGGAVAGYLLVKLATRLRSAWRARAANSGQSRP